MRHIFEVTMVIRKPTEDPHLNRVTYRLYSMTRQEAIEYAVKAAGPGYDCLYVIAGPRLDD